MGEPGIPQAADGEERIIDDLVGHVDIAHFLRVLQELGDDEVFALRRQLDEPIGLGRRQPCILELEQDVILVFDESPHRSEANLVLERAVEHGASHLVPAIRPQVGLGVQLAEDVGGRVSFALDTDRCRASRARQAEWLYRHHLDAKLILQGMANRLAAPSGHIQMCAPAPPVGNGEDRFGSDQLEDHNPDGRPYQPSNPDIGWMVDAEVHPGDTEQRDQHRGCDEPVGAPPALRYQR